MDDKRPTTTPPPTDWEKALAGLVFPRMGLWLYISIALCALIWFLAPHMVKVGAYKLALITVAAFIGYHIARALESRGWRPHELVAEYHRLCEGTEEERARGWERAQLASAAYQRRAWLVSACMIAAALGS